jgi:glutaredoxin
MGDTRIDETGNVYGKLTVLGYARTIAGPSGSKRTMWLCLCECGQRREVWAGDLRRKNGKGTRSCPDCARRKHGHTRTGWQSPEYVSWHSMLQRCHNPNNRGYEQYGGRGIRVCDRWRESFEAFLEDMGPTPGPGYTIDRHPNGEGNYEPGNCRWATKTEQARNQRKNRWIEIEGRRQLLVDWLKEFRMSPAVFYDRIRRGMSDVEALTAPRIMGRQPKKKS